MKFADYTAAAAAAPTNAAKRAIYSEQFAYQSQCEKAAGAQLKAGIVVTDGEGFTYTVVSAGPKQVTATYYGNYVKAEYGYKKRFTRHDFVNTFAVNIAEQLLPMAHVTVEDMAVVAPLAAHLEAMALPLPESASLASLLSLLQSRRAIALRQRQAAVLMELGIIADELGISLSPAHDVN